jgi:hypothetical protein
MKTKLVVLVGLLLVLATFVAPVAAVTGNGAPNGAHFNLNLIGVDKTNILPNDANNGNRIFIPLVGNGKIFLTEGSTFNVIDADATDGRAEYMIPAPENTYNSDGTITPGIYQVFVRELGTPGGHGKLTTCYQETVDTVTTEYCSTENVILLRTKGNSQFQDVTKQLTTLYIDGVRTDIFDDKNKDYLWSYDNNGLKNVQLRFYPIAAVA